MRKTSAIEKLMPSVINVLIISVISLPIFYLQIPLLEKKFLIILLFFVYGLIFIIFNKGRDIGMMVYKTYWQKDYPATQLLFFNILYTFSFSSILFWIYFPLDIFLANMLIIQLPTILLTGTTLHGFLSGRMTTVKK